MLFTRRQFLYSSFATSALSLAPLAFASQSVGNATIRTLSDGYLTLPKSFLFSSMPLEPLDKISDEFGLSGDIIEPECNLALLEQDDKKILFDVGSGPNFMPSAGAILDSLEAIDLTPDDITHIVFTHAHPDHLWGLLDDFDDLIFPEAQYFIGQKEWDYWWNPETVNSIGQERAAFAVGAKRRLEALEDNITFINGGDEILSGIHALDTSGHTPGHLHLRSKMAQTLPSLWAMLLAIIMLRCVTPIGRAVPTRLLTTP